MSENKPPDGMVNRQFFKVPFLDIKVKLSAFDFKRIASPRAPWMVISYTHQCKVPHEKVV